MIKLSNRKNSKNGLITNLNEVKKMQLLIIFSLLSMMSLFAFVASRVVELDPQPVKIRVKND